MNSLCPIHTHRELMNNGFCRDCNDYPNKTTQLTEDDFSYIHWDKDSGGPELFQLIIYGKSKYDCDTIKEQILRNQKKAEKYNDFVNCCQHSDDEYCIWNHELHIAEQKIRSLEKKLANKNIKHLHKKDLDNLKDYREKFLENKKIIEKIKIIFDDGSVDDDTFFPKLKEILGGDS